MLTSEDISTLEKLDKDSLLVVFRFFEQLKAAAIQAEDSFVRDTTHRILIEIIRLDGQFGHEQGKVIKL